MQTHAGVIHDGPPMVTVDTPEDIVFLIKESEIITGQSGRTFVIAGADWLTYRVHWHPRGNPTGVRVERLDEAGKALNSRQLLPREFVEHSLIEALAAGQLFTPPVRRPG